MGALRQSTKGRLPVLDGALRAQARRRRLRRDGLAVVMLLFVVLVILVGLALGPGRQPVTRLALGPSRQPIIGVARTGAVTGYIQPCGALEVPLYASTGARLFSAAATVEALPGREYWKPVGDGIYRRVLPAAVAARERVSQNQQFRLDHLAPGRYVILAQYAGSPVSTSLEVSVAPGKVTQVDLLDTCS